MLKLMCRLALLFLAFEAAALAQISPGGFVAFVSVDPTGGCNAVYITQNVTTGVLSGCVGGNWQAVGGGSGPVVGGQTVGTTTAGVGVSASGCTLSTGVLTVTSGTACTFTHNLNLASPYVTDLVCANSTNGYVDFNPLLSGMTAQAITFTPTVSASVTCSVTGLSAGSGITPTSLGPFTSGQTSGFGSFSETSCSTGTWSASSGLASAGLAINSSSGAITGTATSSGSPFTFTVTYGACTTPTITLTVNAAPSISLCGGDTVPSCPGGTSGISYGTQSLTTTGGTGAKTCAQTGGSTLPGTMAVNSNCTITGTPSGGSATYSPQVKVTDSLSVSGSPVTLNIVVTGSSGFTLVTSGCGASANGSATSVTVPSSPCSGTSLNMTGANLIVVCGVISSSSAIADSLGNTYTWIPPGKIVGSATTGCFYTSSPTVSSSMTFTCGPTPGCGLTSLEVFGWSGAAGSSPLDTGMGVQANTNSGTNTVTPVSSGSATPTNADELVIESAGSGGNAAVWSGLSIAGSGCTWQTPVVVPYASGTNYGSATTYCIQTGGSPSAVDPTWTFGGNSIMVAMQFAFIP